ncbi:hypothetical protein BBI01_01420 [Chryseobacterium artocarpi]|uniref:Uncharacterized protein n=1 Tax=Chryseobacterium artocarpi TaxID=1414727 RepID=A0A1B9A001_9FLAO|nr:hypothetical protein [Chryseobacterium artocarpi]OCA77150.1 hypothetical protein BBI01_01420 [Chryseobacterium artocarpi]
MKIYNAHPEGNEMASLEPARYFNLAIEQVEQISDSCIQFIDNVSAGGEASFINQFRETLTIEIGN